MNKNEELENYNFDITDDSSEISSSDERDFFNQYEYDFTEQKEPAKWQDSEEDEEFLRTEYKLKNNMIWKENKKTPFKNIKTNNISYKQEKNILMTNNNIKLAKVFGNLIVLITTMNDIYIINDLNEKKYKVVNVLFSISDFDFLDENRILLISKKCGIIKELNIESGVIKDIKKGNNKKFHKIIVSDYIYILSEILEIYDKENFDYMKLFSETIIDFTLTDSNIVLLKKDRSIAIYDRESFEFISVKKYEDKYFFNRIYSTGHRVFLCMNQGIKILNNNCEIEKEIFDVELSNFTQNEKFIALSGNAAGCLRVIKKSNLRSLNSFPPSNFNLPKIKEIFMIENVLYYIHSSYISRIKFYDN